MHRVRDGQVLDWLEQRSSDDGFTGFDATGWPASTWILHAMYEHVELPEGLTHDEVHRMELAAGAKEPLMLGDANVDDPSFGAWVTGGGLGRSSRPGPDWDRLSWRDLAERLGIELLAGAAYPTYDAFPYRSWPVSIEPPSEGSLDREQFLRLVDQLTLISGADSECLCYFSPLAAQVNAAGDLDMLAVYLGSLAELPTFYDDERFAGSPTNLWPTDRSWLVYTDWDLWGTKVSGSTQLIGWLDDDPELETIHLPREVRP